MRTLFYYVPAKFRLIRNISQSSVSLMSHVGGKTPISDHRGSDASTCLNNGVRDGPLEKLWGGGGAKYRKKIHAREN